MWAKVDDGFPDHDKVAEAGERLEAKQPTTVGATGTGRVVAVWLQAVCYSNAKLTDGFVTNPVARRFHCDRDPLAVLSAMVNGSRGLVKKVRGGWRILNFHRYQPTKKDVEEQRKKARDRMKRLREGRSDRSRNVRANISDVRANFGEQDRSRSQHPSRPDPIDQDQDPPAVPAGTFPQLNGDHDEGAEPVPATLHDRAADAPGRHDRRRGMVGTNQGPDQSRTLVGVAAAGSDHSGDEGGRGGTRPELSGAGAAAGAVAGSALAGGVAGSPRLRPLRAGLTGERGGGFVRVGDVLRSGS